MHDALFASGFETPEAIIKTHHGLIADSGKKLVLGGHVDAGVARASNKVEKMRLLADYGGELAPLSHGQSAVEQGQAFVAAVHGLIEGLKL